MHRFLLRILILFLLFSFNEINGQTAQNVEFKAVKYRPNVDAPLTSDELLKIREVYKDSTEDVILNDKAHLKRIKHLLRNRINILRLDIKGKQRNYIPLSEVELFNHYNPSLERDVVFDKYGFNPLKYNLNFYPSQNLLYRIDGTSYFIQIMSQFQ
ncbi:hypothetical protein [Winogradskyella vincentii]|uniref:POTRA domain-containing protein n=1 Tax=Winogradskyella vincentii TaxID=2877122 RepID=A0ABS7Y3E6_9FLAO|nr:hypothetical protein [Winogradskyella vincentii]MCA0154444.1 hypothetical protein [Winogradskyella vincentii]